MTLNRHKHHYSDSLDRRVNQLGKLINRTPGVCLLIKVFQAWFQEYMLNHLTSLAMSSSVLEALPGKLDIKRHSPINLYLLFDCTAVEATVTKNPQNLYNRHICKHL